MPSLGLGLGLVIGLKVGRKYKLLRSFFILPSYKLTSSHVYTQARSNRHIFIEISSEYRNLRIILGIIQKRVYPVTFDAKKGNVFLALGRGAVRALNTSKTRSSASAPRPRCLGSIPDHFFPFSKVLLGRTAAPKMRACTSTLFCKEIRRVHPALS